MLGNFVKYKYLNRGNKVYFLFDCNDFDPDKEYIMLVTRYHGEQPRYDLHYTWTTELTDVITDNMKTKKGLLNFFQSKKVDDLRKSMLIIGNRKHTSIEKMEQYANSDSEYETMTWNVYNLKEYVEGKKFMAYVGTSEYTYVYDIYEFDFSGDKYKSVRMVRGVGERSLIDDGCIRDRQSLFMDGDAVNTDKIYNKIKEIGENNGIL